jgi:hypothetical protein
MLLLLGWVLPLAGAGAAVGAAATARVVVAGGSPVLVKVVAIAAVVEPMFISCCVRVVVKVIP